MKGTAKFNSKKTKRYFLSRSWSSKPVATWIMLNPSIADDKLNDRTINRCINFTKSWNYGGLNVVNLCSDINTKPFEILKKLKSNYMPDPKSLHYIDIAINNCKTIYCAWGFSIEIPDWLKTKLRDKQVKALCLSTLKTPMHPLYISSKTIPKDFIF